MRRLLKMIKLQLFFQEITGRGFLASFSCYTIDGPHSKLRFFSFITGEILYSILAVSDQGSYAKPLYYSVVLTPRQELSSHPLKQMVWLYWLQDRDIMPNWYTINHRTTLHTHNETSDPLLLVDGTKGIFIQTILSWHYERKSQKGAFSILHKQQWVYPH